MTNINTQRVREALNSILEEKQFMDKNPTGDDYIRTFVDALEKAGYAVLDAVHGEVQQPQPDLLASDVELFNQTVDKFATISTRDVAVPGGPTEHDLEIDAYGTVSELRSQGWVIIPPVL